MTSFVVPGVVGFAKTIEDLPPNCPKDIFGVAQCGTLYLLKEQVEKDEYSIRFKDKDGNGLLHWAAYKNTVETVEWLIKKGAPLEERNSSEQQTPLHWAAISGNIAAIHTLLLAGADMHARDKRGYNALVHAVQYDRLLCCHYLIYRGVAVESVDNSGHTTLHWAAFQGHADIVRYLIKRGANISAVDHGGMTPLHWAASRGNKQAAGVLLDAGASVTPLDGEGRTVVEVANANGNKMSAKLIENFNRFSWFRGRHKLAFVTMTLALLILYLLIHTASWQFSGAYLCTLFGVGRVMNEFRSTRSLMVRNAQLVVFWATFIASGIMYLLVIAPLIIVNDPNSSTMAGVFVGSSIVFAIAFVRFTYSDPGFVPYDSDMSSIARALDKRELLPSICSTCVSRRPIRSKHCPTCDRCVAKMDHHCGWLGTCVGAHNHKSFLVVVATTCVLHCVFAYYCWCYLYMQELPESWFNALVVCAQKYSLVTLLGFFHAFNTFWESVVLYAQLQGISIGMTTNESFNSYRYNYMRDSQTGQFRNPFDLGSRRANLNAFWFSSTTDWARVFSEQQALSPDSDAKNV